MRRRFTGLWHHADFRKLWAAQTISVFGSQVTQLALPLTAVLLLDATPVQMGVLGAARMAPFLLIGLLAGVWVDRLRRRPLMIGADIGRALLLGSIPLAAALDRLDIAQLYVVVFLAGVLTVFFDVAYQALLPSLVGRAQLIEGNSKLESSNSLAQVAGPGLGGGLVQLLTAPATIALDALSFLISALFLVVIRTAEPEPTPAVARRSVRAEIGEGLRLVAGNPLLRAIAACTATLNLFGAIIFSLLVLYMTRERDVPPGLLGVAFAVGSAGGVVAALVAGRAARRFGLGRALIGALLISSIGSVIIVLAAGPRGVAAAILALAWALVTFGGTAYNINQVSLRQAITPNALLGRMNATMRFIVWGTIPIGFLAGGALGSLIGLRPAITIGATGGMFAVLWLLASPVRTLRKPPAPVEDLVATAHH